MKESTILVLAGIGVGGYLLYKSDFFSGLGKTGEAIGTAAEGLGSGVSTIGREAGDIVVDVGSVLEPFAALFQGTSNLIEQSYSGQVASLRREQEQSNTVDIGAFEISKDPLIDIQAESDINTAQQKSLRKSMIQDNLTDFTRYFTNYDEVAAGAVSTAKNVIIGGVSSIKNAIESVTGSSKSNTLKLPSGSSSSPTSKTPSVRTTSATNATPTTSTTRATSSTSTTNALKTTGSAAIKVLNAPSKIITSQISKAYSTTKSLLRRLF